MRNLLLALILSLSTVVLAQPAAPADAPHPEVPAASPKDAPTAEKERTAATGKGPGENALPKAPGELKLSGYIQGRYTYPDNTPFNGFNVRRGRLKATYTTSWSEYVLQIDAVPRGVSLKDAEVHLIEPWTGYGLRLVVGQTKLPFGYEVTRSSSELEMPERSRVVRAFVAGERDRGLKLVGKVQHLRMAVGVFDGNGTEDRVAFGVDNDKNKDVVGRLGMDLEWIAGGVSGWWGRTWDPGSRTTYDRNRIGADLQLRLEPVSLGATTLKAELIAGRTWRRDGVEQLDVPALGWYALLLQELGQSDAIALRYDHFDPLAGTPDGVTSSTPPQPLATNAIGTLGLTYLHHFGRNLKASVTYEVPMTGTAGRAVDPRDNVLTLQMQGRF